jgi:hypothetical protein
MAQTVLRDEPGTGHIPHYGAEEDVVERRDTVGQAAARASRDDRDPVGRCPAECVLDLPVGDTYDGYWVPAPGSYVSSARWLASRSRSVSRTPSGRHTRSESIGTGIGTRSEASSGTIRPASAS